MHPSTGEATQTLDSDAFKLYEKYKSLKMKGKNKPFIGNTDLSHTRLDSMIICSKCNGVGICKEIYNHQSRDINCTQCDSEGILWKTPMDGELVNTHSSIVE